MIDAVFSPNRYSPYDESIPRGEGNYKRLKANVRVSDGCPLPYILNSFDSHTIPGGLIISIIVTTTTLWNPPLRPSPNSNRLC
jgi:hypothetical protein